MTRGGVFGQHGSHRRPARPAGMEHLDQEGPEGLQGCPKTLTPLIVFARRRQDIRRPKVLIQAVKTREKFTLENRLEMCHPTHHGPPFCIEWLRLT